MRMDGYWIRAKDRPYIAGFRNVILLMYIDIKEWYEAVGEDGSKLLQCWPAKSSHRYIGGIEVDVVSFPQDQFHAFRDAAEKAEITFAVIEERNDIPTVTVHLPKSDKGPEYRASQVFRLD